MLPVVLVVDDCEDNLDLFSAVLEREGFEVLTASNGADALRLAAEHRPPVIVTDLAMPGMDGFEVIRRLRADQPEERFHVVVVSAFGDAASRHRAWEAGCDDYLVKPVTSARLVDGVRLGLAKSRTKNRTAASA